MSSHHEWAEQVCKDHGQQKPFAPENGSPLRFSIGDQVVYTNDYGVTFRRTIVGLYRPNNMCSLYARGYRYMVDSTCPWMPVKESSLQLAE